MERQDAFLSQNRSRILAQYEKLEKKLPEVFGGISVRIQGLSPRTALACKYLYGTMPVSDIGNYSFEIFLEYASHGVFLYENFEKVRALPELLFLNYVLYHRVNEEEIAPCRSLFYEQMQGIVKGKSIKEAALEVNYWCAGEASYHSTDDRTLSALAVFHRGSGRCGEESVFTVNAMRSVGIPARQVYAPKWSHCDDNHAWVEIWCDGTWYFMGACEPEPILNKGWFTNASSRAMMIHSRWFDQVDSEEEIIGKDGMVTMQNELRRYALVRPVTVKVEDENGLPAAGAAVFLEALNYSEYSPVVEGMTDGQGMLNVTLGLGSVHVWVEKNGVFGEGYLDTREQNAGDSDSDNQKLESAVTEEYASETQDGKGRITCVVRLGAYQAEEIWKPVDMIAPLDAPVNTAMPTIRQKQAGSLRLSKMNEKRREKTADWKNPELAVFSGRDEASSQAGKRRRELLEALTIKDRSDCAADVLEEHFQEALPYENTCEPEIFVPYILNPRVDDEVLKPYRRQIQKSFTKEEQNQFRKDPKTIWSAVKARIVSCPESERTSVITVPAGCLRLGIGSLLSQKILFVAIARTFGIPARLNPSDKTMEYWEKGAFVPVLPETAKDCKLVLKEMSVTWKYFQNWSLARLEKDRFVSLKLGDRNWEQHKLSLQLEAGQYRILTSNRLTNGSIFAYEYEFELKSGEEKEIELRLRQAKLADMLEHISLPEFQIFTEQNNPVKGSELLKSGRHILMFLEETKEPTEHILNEMKEQKEGFAGQADNILFVVRSKEALQDPVVSHTLKLFPEISVYYDDFTENIELLARRMYVDPDKLPLIIVTEDGLNGIYAASGYNVGTGDMLLRVMDA